MMTLLATILLLHSDDPTLWALIGAGAGVYLFYRGFQLFQRRRLILNVPASKVRSASLGLVEVSGLACGPCAMPAPITAMPCYYYRTQAWELRQSGKDKEWRKVADESQHVPFYLDDNTGRVMVDPRGAEMDLHRDFHEEYQKPLFGSLDAPATVASFMARHGISGEHSIKIDEYCIKPKNALFILGTLAENPGLSVTPTPVPGTSSQHSFDIQLPGTVSQEAARAMEVLPGVNVSWKTTSMDLGSASSAQASVAVAKGSAPPEKIAAALIKAGITSPAAWAAAGLSQPGAGGSPASNIPAGPDAGAFDLNPKTVLMKGQNNPAFFISWRSQREVAQSLGWQSTLMIWGGPALTLVSLFVLLAHFGWL